MSTSTQAITPPPGGGSRATGDVGTLRRRALGLEYMTVAWMATMAALVASRPTALAGMAFDAAFHGLGAFVVIGQLRGERRDDAQRVRIIALSFLVFALSVTAKAVFDLLGGRMDPEPALTLALYALAMGALGAAKRRTGRADGNPVLAIDSTGTLLCASLAASSLAGLGLVSRFGWWWAEPIAWLGIAAWAAGAARAALEREKSRGFTP